MANQRNQFLIATLFLCVGCFFNVSSQIEYINDDGVYVEVNKNKIHKDYNWDNEIYTKGRVLYFNYSYSKSDKKRFFDLYSNGGWFFSDTVSIRTVEKIKITVLEGLEPFIAFDSSYNQTVMRMDYITQSGVPNSERTGIVENKKNVWLHPPRSALFKVLELNPFPFIQTPYKIGNKWTWHLDIGGSWGDSRWCEWNGIVKNEYQYEIVAKNDIDTRLGVSSCFVVDSKAVSILGDTYLRSYFNEKYGFVRYEYINIDKSKLSFELTEIE